MTAALRAPQTRCQLITGLGSYHYVGVRDVAPGVAALLLDTNVVVHMERMLRLGPSALDERRRRCLRTLIAGNRDTAMTVAEAVGSRAPGPAPRIRALQLAYAAKTVTGWELGEVDAFLLADRTRPMPEDFEFEPPSDYLETAIQRGYALLLKLHLLERGIRSRPVLAVVESYLRWANEEMRYISSCELQVALDFILARSGVGAYTQKCLKMGAPNPLHRVRTTAWDSFMFRLVDFAASGVMGGDLALGAGFVSDDGLVPVIRSRCRLRSVIDTAGAAGQVGMVEISIEESPGASSEQVYELFDSVVGDDQSRRFAMTTSRTWDDEQGRIDEIVLDLERDVLAIAGRAG